MKISNKLALKIQFAVHSMDTVFSHRANEVFAHRQNRILEHNDKIVETIYEPATKKWLTDVFMVGMPRIRIKLTRISSTKDFAAQTHIRVVAEEFYGMRRIEMTPGMNFDLADMAAYLGSSNAPTPAQVKKADQLAANYSDTENIVMRTLSERIADRNSTTRTIDQMQVGDWVSVETKVESMLNWVVCGSCRRVFRVSPAYIWTSPERRYRRKDGLSYAGSHYRIVPYFSNFI